MKPMLLSLSVALSSKANSAQAKPAAPATNPAPAAATKS